jgi:hypothetical protein
MVTLKTLHGQDSPPRRLAAADDAMAGESREPVY